MPANSQIWLDKTEMWPDSMDDALRAFNKNRLRQAH